ncbi:hypothetical protein ACMFMG_005059 [Clarireedia jacksonii]
MPNQLSLYVCCSSIASIVCFSTIQQPEITNQYILQKSSCSRHNFNANPLHPLDINHRLYQTPPNDYFKETYLKQELASTPLPYRRAKVSVFAETPTLILLR